MNLAIRAQILYKLSVDMISHAVSTTGLRSLSELRSSKLVEGVDDRRRRSLHCVLIRDKTSKESQLMSGIGRYS